MKSQLKPIVHLATLFVQCEAKTGIRRRDWLKLAGKKICREQVGTVPTFLSVRANKFVKWKIGLTYDCSGDMLCCCFCCNQHHGILAYFSYFYIFLFHKLVLFQKMLYKFGKTILLKQDMMINYCMGISNTSWRASGS